MKRTKDYYHYFVEGADDKKVVNTLKTDLQKIVSGKVENFNVVQKKLNKGHIRLLKTGTIVVLVFDVDVGNIDILKENIAFLKEQKNIKDIICITQVMNLEEELVRSCSIKEIKELTKSKSNREFKRDVLRISNLKERLESCEFDFEKFWRLNPQNKYNQINNEAYKIKL